MKYIALPSHARNAERRLSFYLAMEEYLARTTAEQDLFFLWQVEPSVIFGRNQDIWNEVNVDFCRYQGIGMYRRKSGGGCVYADRGNVMFSYITKDENVNLTFHRFINMLVLVLRRLGLEATASERNDVLVGGRKVSGTAFYHLPGASIVHGTMLYDTTMENMLQAITPPQAKLQRHGVKSVRQRIGLLKDHLSMGISEFKDFARQTLCDDELLLCDADVEAIEALEQSYLREEFIFGRKQANHHNNMENKRTCLYDKHVALGALMSPFAGFEMPIQYSNITDEHQAVRTACGVFDVSHMGEVTVKGPDAERYVQHIFTNNVAGAPDGKIFYGMMCYENGGTVDDLLVYKMAEQDFFLVINAANIDKDWAWMQQQAEGFDIDLQNRSDHYGQIAVQGPEAEQVVEEVLGLACKELEFYTVKTIGDVIVSRTGYTGEDGFEIYATPEYINECWDKLMACGRCKPCGLGCRDTLRFEVGLPLYGDELSADISPVMAGLSMFVKLDKEEFVGKEALALQKAEGVTRKLVGIELADKAIPRHGYTVLNADGEAIGEVTTGYHCISVDKSVCMALIDSRYAKLSTPLQVQIRKKVFPGTVVKKQFYNKSYKK